MARRNSECGRVELWARAVEADAPTGKLEPLSQQIRKRRPDALTVFIMPPSCEELERRLRGRQTDTEEVIQRRLRGALSDMGHWHEFDFVVINENLDQAAAQLAAIVNGRGKVNRTEVPELKSRVEEILVGED